MLSDIVGYRRKAEAAVRRPTLYLSVHVFEDEMVRKDGLRSSEEIRAELLDGKIETAARGSAPGGLVFSVNREMV